MAMITIGLPVYNGARHLPQAVDSILAQSFSDLELVISDNASTDGTPALCQQYCRRDARVRYLRQPKNVGAVPNHNLLFGASSSKYFKWASCDDLLAPGFVEGGVDALEHNPDAVLYSPAFIPISEDGTPFALTGDGKTFIGRSGRSWNCAIVPELAASDPARRFAAVILSVDMCREIYGVMRSSALQRTRLMGEYYGSDKVLLAELSLLGPYSLDPHRLFYWRDHGGQSIRLPHRAKGRWVSARAGSADFQRLRKILGYWRAMRGKGLSWEQRIRCVASLWTRSFKPGRIQQLIEEMAGRSA